MVSIVFYCTVFVFIYEYYLKEGYYFSPVVHSLLGIVLGLFLVFRTNTAYDKWWEGRKIWGSLVNDSRNLALKLNAMIPGNPELRRYFSTMISAFPFALKEHLRDGVKMDEIKLDEPLKSELGTWDHKPNFIAKNLYEKINGLYKDGQITGDQYFIIDKEVKALTDHVGMCERIKNTPIPYSYSMYMKKFIFVYSVTLPFGFVSSFHYWTILVVAMVFYFLITIELIAEEIEDPFGLDDNDLPTDTIAGKIGQNVREILGC